MVRRAPTNGRRSGYISSSRAYARDVVRATRWFFKQFRFPNPIADSEGRPRHVLPRRPRYRPQKVDTMARCCDSVIETSRSAPESSIPQVGSEHSASSGGQPLLLQSAMEGRGDGYRPFLRPTTMRCGPIPRSAGSSSKARDNSVRNWRIDGSHQCRRMLGAHTRKPSESITLMGPKPARCDSSWGSAG